MLTLIPWLMQQQKTREMKVKHFRVKHTSCEKKEPHKKNLKVLIDRRHMVLNINE